MSFLSKLSKDLGGAAEKARFEADKALKLNRLGGELGGLNDELQRALGDLATKAMELRAAGQLNVPELDTAFAAVETIKQQVATKQAEIDVLKVAQFVAPAAAAGAAAAPAAKASPAGFTYGDTSEPPPAPVEGAPAEGVPPKFCPNCGTASEGAKFCPNCGQKLA